VVVQLVSFSVTGGRQEGTGASTTTDATCPFPSSNFARIFTFKKGDKETKRRKKT
jgi:hypothetical protein